MSMSATTARWLARGAGVATLALSVVALYFSGSPFTVTYLVIPVVLALLGVLVATRQRSNPIGWILLGVSAAFAANNLAVASADYAQAIGAPPSAWWVTWLGWFQNWSWISYFPGGMVLLFLLLPDGRLPGRRWRWLVWFVALYIPVLMLATAIDPTPITLTSGVTIANPVGLPSLASSVGDSVGTVALLPEPLLMIAAIVALILRLVRSRGEERQQMKWIVFASVLTILAVVTAFVVNTAGHNGTVFSILSLVGLGIVLPGGFGVAILKYRLYQIDVVISRTLVYGALAGFITLAYVGIVVGIGSLIGGGGTPNLALSILATAVVAVGFQPLRDRLQKLANRLVYGKRASPYEVLSEFSERVAESYAAADVLPRMARVLQEGTGAEAATIWLRSADRLDPVATHPDTVVGYEPIAMTDGVIPEIPNASRAVPVRHQDELLGALTLLKRRGEALTPIEDKLVDDLAHQAGLVLKNVGLTAALQRRLDELRASRQRLVAAQDEERRRLERNLHDGAQQNLVAIKVKLGLAELLTTSDPGKAGDLISSLKADTDEALETLRELARGIYPPLLADKGLKAALESQARKATLPVTVEADGTGRYEQDVEAAVYFCVLEALQNVQKYAAATSVVVRLAQVEGRLQFEVVDDGRGFDQAHAARGAGLTNMEDRLDALAGSLAISSEPGRFTRVSGSLPLRVVDAPV
jgi:signal transduction histidine kinase